MDMSEAKAVLEKMGLSPVEGEMVMQLGDYEHHEPLLGVVVSPKHQCIDPSCHHGVHMLGTKTVINLMTDRAFRIMLREELAYDNR